MSSSEVDYKLDDLEFHLRKFSRRIRLRNGWLLTQRTLWIAALMAVFIQVVGRVYPIEKLGLWTMLPFLVWIIIVLIYSAFKPQPLMQIAQGVDLELDLKERLSTALAMEGRPRQSLTRLQHQDALMVAAAIIPAEAFGLTWLVKSLATGAVLISLVLVSAIMPNPRDADIKQRAEIEAQAKKQAQQIEKTRKEIEAANDISPEMKEELIKKLEELAKALQRNPGNLEQALADLSKLEQELKREIDPNQASRQALLESLASQLAQATGEKKSQDAMQTSEQALDKLAEQIEKMDAEQRQQLAQNLAQAAAQAGQSGDAQLSQALASLAQAVQSGEAQSVQKASQDAKAALSAMSTKMADQAALQRAIAQANASQQALAQTGRQVAQANGNPGQSNPGSMLGNSQTAGSRVSGGGTRANKLPPATGGRRNVNPQGNAPNVPATQLESQVYVPWQKAPSNGTQVFIPGQDTQQGQTTTTESQNPQAGIVNPALIPYAQVFYNYMNAANQAIDHDYIPTDLIDYVKLYFSSLEP